LFPLTSLIGKIASFADHFAAARVHRPFRLIKWQRQTADWAFSIVAAIRLSEQLIITYFSHSFFACFFMLLPMIFLAVNAAIFH
jgi:hypothetical protein